MSVTVLLCGVTARAYVLCVRLRYNVWRYGSPLTPRDPSKAADTRTHTTHERPRAAASQRKSAPKRAHSQRGPRAGSSGTAYEDSVKGSRAPGALQPQAHAQAAQARASGLARCAVP